jgi:hypothetical protein
MLSQLHRNTLSNHLDFNTYGMLIFPLIKAPTLLKDKENL